MSDLELFVGAKGAAGWAAKRLLRLGTLTKPNKMGTECQNQSVRDIELDTLRPGGETFEATFCAGQPILRGKNSQAPRQMSTALNSSPSWRSNVEFSVDGVWQMASVSSILQRRPRTAPTPARNAAFLFELPALPFLLTY